MPENGSYNEWEKAHDAGYGAGYSAGYGWAIEQVIEWLADNEHGEAAEALRYLLSPEGVAEQNERLRALYGSLAELAAEARGPNPDCNCRAWSECPGSTGPDFQGPCPGPPDPIFQKISDR